MTILLVNQIIFLLVRRYLQLMRILYCQFLMTLYTVETLNFGGAIVDIGEDWNMGVVRLYFRVLKGIHLVSLLFFQIRIGFLLILLNMVG